MESYHTVRCLFCMTGKEERVVEIVHQNGWGVAIFPTRTSYLRLGGKWLETSKPLLPGYVFVYSFSDQVRHDELTTICHVIRVLSYNTGQDALNGQDLEFADWIWRQKGKIGTMKALQIGDWVEITDGVFKQLHGKIVRMNRRNKSFLVTLNNTSAIRQIWLTYDLIEKRDVLQTNSQR